MSLNEFLQYMIEDVRDDKKFCFILGAGASKQSGIPTGKELSRKWLTEIQHFLRDNPEEYNSWVENNNIQEDKPELSYSNIFDRRFTDEKDGYSELERIMDNIDLPSCGYSFLAQVLTKTNNKIVITTNFDSLTEDALFVYTNKKPLVVGHEALAGHIRIMPPRPVVIKIHRDLLLSPINSEDGTRKLDKKFAENLQDVFKYYIPIVIGYGGNDGSLMDFLLKLGCPNKIYWCYRNKRNSLNPKVEELVKKNNGKYIKIEGFDEFMIQIGYKYGYLTLQNEMKKLNEERITKYINQYGVIKDKFDKNSETTKALSSMIYRNTENSGDDYLLKAIFEENSGKKEMYFKKALEIEPDNHGAFNRWGIYLGNLAKTKEGKEAEELYYQAFEKFNKTLKIKPDSHEAFYNWGTALGNLAMTKEGKEAEELYNQAFEKFNKAIEIKPDKHEAFYNWGTALGNLAETKEGKEAKELYYQAFEKFNKAVEIKPDKHEAFYNWGTALGNLAKTKEYKEAVELYNQSFEKFKKSIEIKPDKHEAYYGWGTCLGNMAEIKEGKEAEELYNQAFEKFNKAIELGGSSYNLACLYALRKLKSEALKYLEISLSKHEISVTSVLEDEDWNGFLKDTEFINLIEKYKK